MRPLVLRLCYSYLLPTALCNNNQYTLLDAEVYANNLGMQTKLKSSTHRRIRTHTHMCPLVCRTYSACQAMDRPYAPYECRLYIFDTQAVKGR